MANLSDLIAQSTSDNPQKLVNLALATQMMGSGSGLGGTNYVFVKGDGTPEENALELQAKYNEAKTMPRYLGLLTNETSGHFYPGQTFALQPSGIYYYKVIEEFEGTISSSTAYYIQIAKEETLSVRATVIVAPGEYTFTAPFTVDTPYINIVSLTGNADVLLDGINVTADNVYLKGLNCGANTFTVGDNLNMLVCENCTGGAYSFVGAAGDIASGTFKGCVGGNFSFGGNGTASGTFTDCTGGDYSFGGGGDGTASGTFKYCTGGNYSFGGNTGIASGTFNDCTGGSESFGGGGGTTTADSVFNYCTGGNYSFGGEGGTASGTFTNCTGWYGSFGGYDGTITYDARLYYCKLTSGIFTTPQTGGKLVLCIDGNDAIVTTA